MDIAQHKARLRHYFDGIGFERWSTIYGQGHLSPIRRSVRAGHAAMLAVANSWLDSEPLVTGAPVLDAGCGTGLFSLDLARRGLHVVASDLAPQMVAATEAAVAAAGLAERVSCQVADLEELDGSYALVACFDVLIHYPPAPFTSMLAHLAGLSSERLLFTYAPWSPLLAALHRVGGYFPRGQRRTEIQMMRAEQVQATLTKAGMQLRRSERVSRGFYHVALVEAVRCRQ